MASSSAGRNLTENGSSGRDERPGAQPTPRSGPRRRAWPAGPGDMPQRVALLHAIFVDSGGNHAFPEVALHGALWAYGFYERRGVVSRMISYRYVYDREERARRAYMLFEFSQGFKQANRSVFIDTYTNYFFTQALRRGAGGGGDDRAGAARGPEPGPPRRAGPSARCRSPSAGRCSRRRCCSSRRPRSGRRSGRRWPSSTARS